MAKWAAAWADRAAWSFVGKKTYLRKVDSASCARGEQSGVRFFADERALENGECTEIVKCIS